MPILKKAKDLITREKVSREQLQTVFGDSGTERFNGYLTEEPNIKWRDTRRVENVEEMRRTDGSVKAVLNAMKAPIISAKWDVIGEDEEKVQFVKDNVFNLQSGRCWSDLLKEQLTFFDFGYSVFELVWGVQNGRLVLVDIAPRIQRSIKKFQMDDGGAGVKQRIYTDQHPTRYANIPMEKLLILTNDKEGDDVTGQSVLRAAYKHYKYKDVLYRIQGIAAERYGVGVPVYTLGETTGEAEKDAAEEAMMNLRSNEKGYLVKHAGEEVDILTPKGNALGDSIEKAIDHHNKMIQLSVLANFLSLGDDSVGSFALSTSKISFFLKHIDDKARYISEQFTKQVIAKLIRYNFGEDAEVPQLVHSNIVEADMAQLADTYAKLAEKGLIQTTPEVVKHVHTLLNLPEPEEVEQEEREDQEKEDDAEMAEVKKKEQFLYEKPYEPYRSLTLQEERADLERLNAEYNQLEKDLEDGMIDGLEKEIERLTKKAEQLTKEGDAKGISALEMTALLWLISRLNKTAKQSYAVGKKGAAKELAVDEPRTPQLDTQVRQAQIEQIKRRIKTDIEQEAQATVREAIATGAAATATAVAVKRRVNAKAAELVRAVTQSYVGENVNKGRKAVFYTNLEKITHFQRSEVLDGRTCNTCLSLDKRIVEADDPFAHLEIVHTHCRGTWVPIWGEDPQPTKREVGLPKTIRNSFDTVDGRPSVNRFKGLKRPTNKKANEEAKKEIQKRLE